MHRIFGRSAPPPKSKQEELTLDQRSERAEEMIKAIDIKLLGVRKKLASCTTPSLREALRKRATTLLNQRRLHQSHVDDLSKHMLNLGQVNIAKDTVESTISTLRDMKKSTRDLKANMKKVNINQVERAKDEMEDLIYQAEEISEILGRNYKVDDIEEDELDAELDMINEDELFADQNEDADLLKELELIESTGANELDITAPDTKVPDNVDTPMEDNKINAS